GVTAQDAVIAQTLRESGRPIWLAVNKAEGLDRALAGAEFHELGLGDPWPIAAAHGDGVAALVEAILDAIARAAPGEEVTAEEAGGGAAGEGEQGRAPGRPRIAVVGRPNAGK